MKKFLTVLAILAAVCAAVPAQAATQVWEAQQSGANTGISRWDDATGTLLGHTTAGNLVAPRGMEYDFNLNQMYVSAYTSGVAAYNPDGTFINYKYTGDMTGNAGSFAWDIAMDDTYVYVGQFSGRIHRFLKDGTPAGAQSGSIHSPNNGFSSGGLAYLDGKLFISHSGSSGIDVYNAATGVWSNTIATSAPSRELEAANGKLYYQNSTTMYSINPDGTGNTVVLNDGNFNLTLASGFGISPDGTRASVIIASQAVREFNLNTNMFIRQFNPTTASGLNAVAYTPEPASLALLGLGGLMLIRRRR